MKIEAVGGRSAGCGTARISLRALVLLSGTFLLIGTASTAQQNFESPPTFLASKILPPNLLAGPDHRVVEQVANDGFMNIYTINSRFGSFTAHSTEELRIKVGEVNGIAKMEDWSESEQFIMGMRKAGRDVLQSSARIITDPLQTVKDTAGGVKAIFSSLRRSLSEDDVPDEDTTEGEGVRDKVRDLIGYSLAKRQYAAAFGVDPYSTNPVLQRYLDHLSRAGFAGDFGTSTALGFIEGGVGTATSVAGHLQSLRDEVRDRTPAELREINEQKLRAMGVEQSLIDLYLGNYVFSPTYQTAFVDALDEIDEAGGRGEFVKVAILAKDEDQALFRVSQARMYANHHASVARIQAFVLVSKLVVVAARTSDGTLVVHVPADYVSFTSNLAAFFLAARNGLEGVPGVRRKQLWLAGGMSLVAREWIEESGWAVHTDTAQQPPPEHQASRAEREARADLDTTEPRVPNSGLVGSGTSHPD